MINTKIIQGIYSHLLDCVIWYRKLVSRKWGRRRKTEEKNSKIITKIRLLTESKALHNRRRKLEMNLKKKNFALEFRFRKPLFLEIILSISNMIDTYWCNLVCAQTVVFGTLSVLFLIRTVLRDKSHIFVTFLYHKNFHQRWQRAELVFAAFSSPYMCQYSSKPFLINYFSNQMPMKHFATIDFTHHGFSITGKLTWNLKCFSFYLISNLAPLKAQHIKDFMNLSHPFHFHYERTHIFFPIDIYGIFLST